MPPNQFAQVTSCTPGVLLIVSAWLIGIWKISDVERMRHDARRRAGRRRRR